MQLVQVWSMHPSLEVTNIFLRVQNDSHLLGVTGAKAGTLSFLVGGTEEAFKQAYPILSHMGQRLIHCGPSGAGLGAKICNNVRSVLLFLHEPSHMMFYS